eukprot:TRINITY_DN15330_c0_g1_i4.p2 TRINITY_DN15330_c0_g1~~TRINITY_DN15330_c0_g1_i4.p2  ORF type:complete len:134 (-),score=29.36 TRINITY_DN15330_c0_g1_i4:24-425(-)
MQRGQVQPQQHSHQGPPPQMQRQESPLSESLRTPFSTCSMLPVVPPFDKGLDEAGATAAISPSRLPNITNLLECELLSKSCSERLGLDTCLTVGSRSPVGTKASKAELVMKTKAAKSSVAMPRTRAIAPPSNC